VQDGERRQRTSLVSWQTLGSGGPTWQREERTAGKARAVEGMARRRVDEGNRRWRRSGAASGRRHARAAVKAEEPGDSRRKTEDPAVKSRKLRGLTVKQ
jgi:hypothetical protein